MDLEEPQVTAPKPKPHRHDFAALTVGGWHEVMWCNVCGALWLPGDKFPRKPTGTAPKSETYKCERCGRRYRDEQLLTHDCTAPKEKR